MVTAKTRSLSQTGPSAVLARIERAVRCTEGFRLCFVRCEEPQLEEKAVAQLLSRLRGKRVLDLSLEAPAESLAHELISRVRPAMPPAAVVIRGLARSLEAGGPALLQRLDGEVELLRATVPGIVLVWLPQSALRQIQRGSPRLWAESSAMYEILSPAGMQDGAAPVAEEPAPEPGTTTSEAAPAVADEEAAPAVADEEAALAVADEEAALVTENAAPEEPSPDECAGPAAERPGEAIGWAEQGSEDETEGEEPEARPEERRALPALHTLTPAQRQAELDHRLSLLEERGPASASGAPESQRLHAVLLYEIGLLYVSRAEWSRAAAVLEESAALFNLTGDRRARGLALAHLGLTRHHQGKLDDAEGLYNLALKLSREQGDRSTEALVLHQSAMTDQTRGYLDEALSRFEESLALKRALGDQRGIAATLHQLGALRQRQQDLPGAIRLYQESLEIKQTLDDPTAAATLHQLGTAEHQQGRLDQAMAYYEESLRIKKSVGDRAGTAITLGQIGRIHQQRGELRDALQHYATSWITFHSLESPYAPLAEKLIRSIRSEAGEAQFEAWLKGDLRSIASHIRRALESDRSA